MRESSQIQLFETESKPDGPVECLGMTFANDAERRAYFTGKLRKKFQDPEFRKIEGFPVGEDEDILALSDPPYYTACPNPWVADFVAQWEAQKPPKPEGHRYHREPFAADVSEGKNDPIYNAHSYHTKVPHKAIMRYILHYTEPGDIIFDGFCGTGMTGVAAQMCGDRKVVESLGYRVEEDDSISRQEPGEDGKMRWVVFSKLGVRQAVLNDLSPAATFIAYNYNTPVDVSAFNKEARCILKEVEKECSWMFETRHTDGRIGRINYTVWSDVFICPECIGEVVFWDAAVDKQGGKVQKQFACPHCNAILTKRNMERAWVNKYDDAIQENIRSAKQVPVLINYRIGRKGVTKTPDSSDLSLFERIENSTIPHWFPNNRLIAGKETRRNDPIGITHSHHFYSRRNLWVFASFLKRTSHSAWRNHFWGAAKDCQSYATKMIKINIKRLLFGGGQFMGFVGGTLYIPSLHAEQSTLKSISTKAKKVASNYPGRHWGGETIIQSGSMSSIPEQPGNSLDYIFLDPPFGSNLSYSELNFLWESWLRIWTNTRPEAIESKTQGKGLDEYRRLMGQCFEEAYRLLKPGRWMTVEFSNTNASVWNSIQSALVEAGFIVANVSALDKKQRSFKAYTTPTAVKQDLIISAYKPNGGFEKRFRQEAMSEEGVWDFVRAHLGYLPVVKHQNSSIHVVMERDPRILFDQMVAYYVRKGYPVPLSSQEFQVGLARRFSERDGMYFLPAQAAEYDRKRMSVERITQATLFVDDESSAIQWLRQLLKDKPQTFQDLNPQFMQQLSGWRKNEQQMDLRELLQQNFLVYDSRGPVPEQIHAYLSSNWKDLRNLPKDHPALVAKAKDRWYVPDPNKQADLEKLRERGLLREFETYRVSKQRSLKVFRLEAVRAGFKKAWQENDYDTIIGVARKIPNDVLQEDPKLLMWYDAALTRTGQTE